MGSQTWTPRHASEVPETATALPARAFNPAIALGALLDGRVADGFRTSDSRRN
ncbi:hypothetical protein KIK06_19610 [Nocardiopsis sp. EMB25]|uniref:hypothetical protein n=1 Tax=Nocardiopsis sp. EMB25 TaxID=2835867 RepID=UPI0022848201|nr:hypothetical protein [Nocardiopsis sp. EMB25]MCY9786103.1 hypothetical protein [Nocardiopsis sp. EMB25]